MQKYKQHRLKLNQVAAAAKAGLSERSARRIEISEALPSQREIRAWRSGDVPDIVFAGAGLDLARR